MHDRALVLADALAAIPAELRAPAELGAGDLVVLAGAWTGRRLSEARVVERFRQATPRGDGEVGRLLFDGVGPRLAARARALEAIREYFAKQGFLEVETPLRVPAPGVDDEIEALAARPGYLVTSPELQMKRLLVGGLPRQYQLARVTRAGELGALHEPEFTLLEWYRAFSGVEDVMEDTEALVVAVAVAVCARPELRAPDGRRISLLRPFPRLRVADAFRAHAGVRDVAELAARDRDRYFELLVGRVEPALAASNRPTFLYDYPLSQAALARACPADARFAERFELYAGGVELCNGYGELTCPREQRKRFAAARARRKQSGRPVYPIDDRFLSALEEGMPPSVGNALGGDRLVALALGRERIEEVMAFPCARL